MLDAVVAGLTLLCGVFFLLRRLVHHVGDELEDIDVPILAIRFALQPVRLASTATMVVRARQQRKHQQPIEPVAYVRDPRRACPLLQRPVLTAELAVQIQEALPVRLRYSDWRLAYAPGVHGTSFKT